MSDTPTGKCVVCGAPAAMHCASVEVVSGSKSSQWFCFDHAPVELRDKMPFGPNKTPADETALLRTNLASLDEHVTDPALRAEIRAELEQLIADIEAGRRRINDIA